MNRFAYELCSTVFVVSLSFGQEIRNQSVPSTTPQPSIVFSVSNDLPLSYPTSCRYLPDEHTTILPVATRGKPGHYNFFVAMANQVGKKTYDGTFVLQTSDLRKFVFAPGFGNPHYGKAVFWSPHHGLGDCGYKTITHFDEQYAAPGSVLQDPTLPPGNLIMIYEAEIHCPPSPKGMGAGWVSIGVTRSSDGGRTWPTPNAERGFQKDWLEYGNGRYAGITLRGTPPKAGSTEFYGDSLPSAFIDDKDPSGDYYVYVPYQFTGDPGTKADARIHIARAKVGDRFGHHEARLHFYKWYQGGWTQEGRGGLEEGVSLPCGTSYGEGGAQIEYNDALQSYMMTFHCTTYVCPSPGQCEPTQLSLYYSTATSLAIQDWTPPQLIENSTYRCAKGVNGESKMDGGYPSFTSPGHEPGHIGLSGMVFLLKGNPLGLRQFVSRSFTIKSTSR
jgi:hypothetical protein